MKTSELCAHGWTLGTAGGDLRDRWSPIVGAEAAAHWYLASYDPTTRRLRVADFPAWAAQLRLPYHAYYPLGPAAVRGGVARSRSHSFGESRDKRAVMTAGWPRQPVCWLRPGPHQISSEFDARERASPRRGRPGLRGVPRPAVGRGPASSQVRDCPRAADRPMRGMKQWGSVRR
ncbi:DciA family protein [Kitasatospora sp. NPDC056531]|uniref:DciA family protein n=1 Tax=Kitasatospora sp. NPDC056531 TaxID=3345856 RepID=UPI0036846044